MDTNVEVVSDPGPSCSNTGPSDETIGKSNLDISAFYPMLAFEKQMFLDVLESDGLTVSAKGLNEYVVIMNLLRSYLDPSNLVFIINAADYEEKYFTAKLKLDSLPNTSAEREKKYLEGGVHFVSTRILVVDLLKSRVPVEHVTGIVVMRAHSILESCQEAFVLRLYRQKNKTGFIKAFSHSAEAFTIGFAHVEKVMRNLFVKEMFLWPRFHGSVLRDLKVSQPNVIELHVPLSSKSTLIQTCILDIMNYTTKELKRINRLLDLQEITTENCLTKKFHKILQSQLDTVWHQLSSRTKELIQDLKVMRSLILSLIHQDAVSFYCLLSKYRSPEYAKVNSGWILLDSAEQLFKYARNRVFNSNKEFDPELCSKWKYLSEILTVEIPEIKKKNKIALSKSKILILCNDSRTARQLNQYLTLGPQAYMCWVASKNELDVPLLSKDYKHLEGKYRKNGESDSHKGKPSSTKNVGKEESASNAEDSVVTKEEIEEEDMHQSNFLLTMTQNIIDKINDTTIKIELSDESCFEPFTQMEKMDLTQLEVESPLIFIQTFWNMEGGVCLEDTLRQLRPDFVIMYHSDVTATRQIEMYNARKDDTYPSMTVFFVIHAQTTEEQAYLTALRREKKAFEHLIQTKSIMVIPSYQDGKSEMPSNLVREDPSIVEENTRKGANRPDIVLVDHSKNTTYIVDVTIPHDENLQKAERDKILKYMDLAHEIKDMWRTPATIVVPISTNGLIPKSLHANLCKVDVDGGLKYLMQKAVLLSTCRTLRGQQSDRSQEKPRVIVDMREFRSDLPALLYKKGIDTDPVTISIGDYILTPDICVERKSLSDLIGSLNSGRLYTQCTQMCRNYARPMLLIEFDQKRPFQLQGSHIVSNDVSGTVVQEKLQLLTLHFPRLKLIWSPSPYATADLFFELKQGRPQPNAADAVALGEDAGIDGLLLERFNTRIHDFLLKLPGVNSKNVARLMNRGGSLDDLIKLEKENLIEILDNKSDAEMLWTILHKEHKPLDANTDNKNVKKNRFGKPMRGKKY